MPKVFVKISSETVRDHHDGEQYGDWETIESYRGCEVFDHEHGEIGCRTVGVEIDFEPQIGQVVFPVIVAYGTGDTFGNSSGNSTVVAVVDTPDKAMEIKKAIEDDYKDRSGGYSISVGGKEIYTYNWKGYFESLEWVRVETELVRA